MMWAALFLTSNVLDLANKVHKALWGFDLEAVSDSCEKNDWTLKKVEREGPLLRAWVITLHPPPHPQPNCLFFFCFFPLQVGDLLSNIFSDGKIHFYIKFMAGLMQISENNIVGQNWT